jgi:hypothetical protein
MRPTKIKNSNNLFKQTVLNTSKLVLSKNMIVEYSYWKINYENIL